MASLSTKHYGTDASLDALRHKAIGDWLLARAGSGNAAPRCAAGRPHHARQWFIRKHREGVEGGWTRPAIKSASNCGAATRARPRATTTKTACASRAEPDQGTT